MTSPIDPEIMDRVRILAARLSAGGGSLVTAESCTGGWVAKACTDLAGSSAWFAGGVVAYTNELKSALLGVRAETLAAHGAVSEAVVREMATGALERLGGTVGVAVSGIAGPDGGSPGKPVGTVWFAWSSRVGAGVEVRAAQALFDGDRAAVRRQAVLRALDGLLAT